MVWASNSLIGERPAIVGVNARVTRRGLLVEALLVVSGAPTGRVEGWLHTSETSKQPVEVTIPDCLVPGQGHVVHPNPRTPENLSTEVGGQYFLLLEVN